MRQSSMNLANSFSALQYEVLRATATLMYLLEGMELVRHKRIDQSAHGESDPEELRNRYPELSYIDVAVSLQGHAPGHSAVLERGGSAEQFAFKGWVEEVYNIIWDSHYRNEVKKAVKIPGVIRPEMDTLGDLRHIRNDLIHGGKARAGETGKCKVLEWFSVGDPIVLSTDHVLDLLNQMGFIAASPAVDPSGGSAILTASPNLEGTLSDRGDYRIVSVRPSVNLPEDGSAQYVVSVVFENGVYIHKEFAWQADRDSHIDFDELRDNVRINDDGNIRLPNGSIMTRENLYHEAVNTLLGPHTGRVRIASPWFSLSRFATEEDQQT